MKSREGDEALPPIFLDDHILDSQALEVKIFGGMRYQRPKTKKSTQSFRKSK